MKAIVLRGFGEPEVITWDTAPDPVVGPGEVAIDIVAAGVNRADLLQRRGHYPPPHGASDILGLECSGRIVQIGEGVTGWNVGDEVCALLAGGGCAERVVVSAGQLLPVPAGVDIVDAAALPEACCTIWSNVFMTAGLQLGEAFLCHGGSSGIGTLAIQLARRFGARVLVTAGAEHKRQRCHELGADVVIDHRAEDFVAAVARETGGNGVDVILDNMGGAYLSRNVEALGTGGRLVVIGLQGGVRGELDLSALMAKQAWVTSTGLRSRSVEEKTAIVAEVREHIWPLIERGEVKPVIDRRLPIVDAADAHRLLEDGEVVGKVILTIQQS